MNPAFDKLMHFATGVGLGSAFWWFAERYLPIGIRRLNPILFVIFVLWGSSGLFLLRWLHIPFFSEQLFYMAIPDWDIPLYIWTRMRFLIHRSWLFHSVLIPLGFIGLSWWGLHSNHYPKAWKWLHDSAIALSVGVTAHLFWDALLSSFKRGFYIHGFNATTSFFWLVINLIAGIGIPFGVVWAMNQRPQPPGIP